MKEFDSDSFDVAWFSFNGIDYVSPEGRVRILEEVRRILRPGGTFCFSSHNLRAKPWKPRLRPSFVLDPNPGRLLIRNFAILRKYAVSHYFYRRNKSREVHGEGFAIRVDQAHEYRLLTYHVSPGYEVNQLSALGFGEIEVLGADGNPPARGEGPSDAWLYYLARKPTAPVQATYLPGGDDRATAGAPRG